MSRMIVRFPPHLKLRLGEWFASVVLFSLGNVLLLWRDMMAKGVEYGIMLYWTDGSQMIWAFFLFGIGSIRLIALIINGRKAITPYIRAALSFLSCFAWWQLTLGFVLSGVPKTGWAIYPWFLLLEIFNTINAFSDARDTFDHKQALRNGTIKTR